jgi:hypothetical protein
MIRMLMATTLAFAIGGANAVSASPMEPTLDQVRAATEKYQDVKVALADGYARDPMDECVTAASIGYPPKAGAMGIHYTRDDLLGITGPPNPRVNGSGTHTDFNQPAVLLYEPQPDGSLKLVAVENLVFEKAWNAKHKNPPTFHGVPYNRMADNPATPIDEGHMFMPHFDRHVWLYRTNPNGVFAQFNPNVNCAAYKPTKSGEEAHHMK